jgi:hypothetical protein
LELAAFSSAASEASAPGAAASEISAITAGGVILVGDQISAADNNPPTLFQIEPALGCTGILPVLGRHAQQIDRPRCLTIHMNLTNE